MVPGKARAMLLFLLVCGAALLGEDLAVGVAEACPLYCLDVSYMTCPSSGNQQLSPRCNCCLTPQGCVLHLTDGSTFTCN